MSRYEVDACDDCEVCGSGMTLVTRLKQYIKNGEPQWWGQDGDLVVCNECGNFGFVSVVGDGDAYVSQDPEAAFKALRAELAERSAALDAALSELAESDAEREPEGEWGYNFATGKEKDQPEWWTTIDLAESNCRDGQAESGETVTARRQESAMNKTDSMLRNYGGDSLRAQIADNLRFLRRGRGVSMRALSVASGVSKTTIWKIENQRIPNPGVLTLNSLARGLRVSLESITVKHWWRDNDSVEVKS